MVGNIQLREFEGLTRLPQRAASAWCGAMIDLVGASYQPLVYLGEQVVKGVNHWFIAEQTLITAKPERRVVMMAINEFQGRCTLVGDTIQILAK